MTPAQDKLIDRTLACIGWGTLVFCGLLVVMAFINLGVEQAAVRLIEQTFWQYSDSWAFNVPLYLGVVILWIVRFRKAQRKGPLSDG